MELPEIHTTLSAISERALILRDMLDNGKFESDEFTETLEKLDDGVSAICDAVFEPGEGTGDYQTIPNRTGDDDNE